MVEMYPAQGGWIEVICGSMFSGKTEELIRRLNRAQYAKQKIQVFKPVIDNRYDADAIVSHAGFRLEGVAVDRPHHISYLLEPDTTVVGIDEIHFFTDEIVDLVDTFANKGIRVICAGLDQDFRGVPFGPVPKLLAIAEYITKTQAICVACGNPASKSQKISGTDEQIEVGAAEKYEARCRRCYTVEKE